MGGFDEGFLEGVGGVVDDVFGGGDGDDDECSGEENESGAVVRTVGFGVVGAALLGAAAVL